MSKSRKHNFHHHTFCVEKNLTTMEVNKKFALIRKLIAETLRRCPHDHWVGDGCEMIVVCVDDEIWMAFLSGNMLIDTWLVFKELVCNYLNIHARFIHKDEYKTKKNVWEGKLCPTFTHFFKY